MSTFLRFFTKPVEDFLHVLLPTETESEKEFPEDSDKMLAERFRRLQRRQEARRKQRRSLILFGVLILAACPLLATVLGPNYSYRSPQGLFVALYGVAFLGWATVISPREVENEIRQTEDELDLLRSLDVSMEQRAQKLFKLHQMELKKYYDQTLKQSKWIFLVGISCLVLGFAVIGASLWLVYKTGEGDKKIIAWLGAIGGVLSNFIAAVYLKMHSETIKSLTEFHNRLVLTHYLHFGNFLLSKIDNAQLREKSLAQVAINLSTNQKHIRSTGARGGPRGKRGQKGQPVAEK
jgi:MFS family permease